MRGKLLPKSVLGLLVLLLAATTAMADVRLPGVFGSHMVLQRDAELPVWGWAEPGEAVAVALGDQTKKTKADADGRWSVALAPMKAGGPHTLKVEGDNTIELADVLIGEVWLFSGQSNMAMSVGGCLNIEAEVAESAKYPTIRMMTVNRVAAESPQDDCGGEWQVCGPDTVARFSATAYFFGRKLHQDLDVPVGLINSSWGGTPVQAWTALEDQQALPALKPMLEEWQKNIAAFDPDKAKQQHEQRLAQWQERVKKAKAAGKPIPRRPGAPADPRMSAHRPANLYNGMIAPLAPLAIRGGIWYQGESNAGRYNATLYGLQLRAMITNWRNLWKQGDFPFLWVQLPNFRAPQENPVQTDGWVIVQEEMLKSLALANTGMAVTIDVGDEKNIHPKNKQAVGLRLALWALGTTYGKDIVHSGPLYGSMSKSDGKITVTFDHTGTGLSIKNGDKLDGFAIAGSDKTFVWADAVVDGNKVVVSSSDIADPVAVRYSWASNPRGNLVNSADLPASPFRTDDWQE